MKIKKYIISEGPEGHEPRYMARVFPTSETFETVACELLRVNKHFIHKDPIYLAEIHSAGFCYIGGEDNPDGSFNVVWKCFGEAHDLKIGTKIDSAQILNALM